MSKASEYAKAASITAPTFRKTGVKVTDSGDLLLEPGDPSTSTFHLGGGISAGHIRLPVIIKAADVPDFIAWLKETFID